MPLLPALEIWIQQGLCSYVSPPFWEMHGASHVFPYHHIILFENYFLL